MENNLAGEGNESQAVVPVSEEALQEEEDHRKHGKKRPGSFWKKPPLKVYPQNFSFGVNGYQPMIDYLDAKDSGFTVKKGSVHLPLLEERCLDQYADSRPFSWYNNRDIDKYIKKGEEISTAIRQNDAIGLPGVLHRTHTKYSMTKKWVQLVKNSHVVDYRRIREQRARGEDPDLTPEPHYELPLPVPETPLPGKSPVRGMTLSVEDALSSVSGHSREYDLHLQNRKDRMKELEDQFDVMLERMTANVQRINERATRLAAVEAEYRNRAMSTHEVRHEAEDAVLRSRMRRLQEMSSLIENVDKLTMLDGIGAPLALQPQGPLDSEEDPEIALLKRKMAAKNRAARLTSMMEAEEEPVTLHPPRHDFEDDLPASRRRKQRDALFSDVHSRIMKRAGEITGQTSEIRRINNMAKYVNIYRPSMELANPDSLVKPTRTELNIDYMAKSLCSRGKFLRRYDVDDEYDPPTSSLNTRAKDAYVGRKAHKPVRQYPSNSLRVRDATIRARTRNTLLGH